MTSMNDKDASFFCYECKYCHYDVFARALCLAKNNLVIGQYDKACDDDFEPRYDVNEDNGMVLMKKL